MHKHAAIMGNYQPSVPWRDPFASCSSNPLCRSYLCFHKEQKCLVRPTSRPTQGTTRRDVEISEGHLFPPIHPCKCLPYSARFWTDAFSSPDLLGKDRPSQQTGFDDQGGGFSPGFFWGSSPSPIKGSPNTHSDPGARFG